MGINKNKDKHKDSNKMKNNIKIRNYGEKQEESQKAIEKEFKEHDE